MNSKTDDFEFKNLYGIGKLEFQGYNSQQDKTTLPPNFMVRGSKNVVKTLRGTIVARDGLKRRGTADATSQGVASSFEWQNSLGVTRVMRVLKNTDGGDGKLQVESNILDGSTYVWYDLMTGLSLTRFVFDAWWNNTLKKDWLLFVKGDNNIHKWDGGIGKIVSTTVNTITLSADAVQSGFDSDGGDLLINGNAYTFSGVSGTTLTGVSGDPTGEAVDSIVLNAVTTTASKPVAVSASSTFTNDFLKVVKNQVYIGSYTSRVVYVSKNTDYLDYTVPSPTVAGSAELLVLDSLARGISVRNGNAWISAGLSDWYEILFTFQTVSTDSVRITTVDKKPTANLSAALAHEFIDTIGDDIVYLSVDQQLRVVGSFRNYFAPQYPTQSLWVKEELQAETFTGGHLRAINESVFITAPNSGKTYWYRNEQIVDALSNIAGNRYWQAPQVWSIQRIALIDGVIYGYSIANPQIYQLFATEQWHDDGPDDEALPYDCVARFAYSTSGRRQGKIQFNRLFFEGYISQGTQLNGYAIFDYLGSTSVQPFIVNSVEQEAPMFNGPLSPSMGDASIGDNPLGDGLLSESEVSQESLPKVKVMVNVGQVVCYEYQIVFFSEQADSRWELLCYDTNAELTPIQGTELNRPLMT